MGGRQTVPNSDFQVVQQPQVRSILPINGINDILAQTRQSSTSDSSTNQPVSVELALQRFLNEYLSLLLAKCGKQWTEKSKNKEITIEQFCNFLSVYMIKYKINTPIRQAMFLAQAIVESNGFKNLKENLNYTKKSAKDVMKRYGKLDQAIIDYQKKYTESNYYKNPQNNTKNQDFFEEYNSKQDDHKKKLFVKEILGKDDDIIMNAVKMLATYKKIPNVTANPATQEGKEQRKVEQNQMANFIAIYGYTDYYGRGLKQLTTYANYKSFELEVQKIDQNIKFCNEEKQQYIYKNGTWQKTNLGFYLQPDSPPCTLPDMILDVKYAVWSACWFFYDKCINNKNCVDECNVYTISIIVNGGEIGLDKRKEYSRYALNLLLDLNQQRMELL